MVRTNIGGVALKYNYEIINEPREIEGSIKNAYKGISNNGVYNKQIYSDEASSTLTMKNI